MSFLSRSPKINLEPLNLLDVAVEYSRVLNISPEIASKMAKLSAGYAFAYQVLGYFFVEEKKTDVDNGLIQKYSSYLYQNGYDVIWKSITANERAFLIKLAESENGEGAVVAAKMGISESYYQNLRRSLLQKGVITATTYGKIDFALPLFSNYVNLIKGF